MDFDLIISGAGPAGLCLARALSGHGLRLAVVEQQPLAALEDPAFDGREIALTQHSAQLMRTLGLWDRIDPQALSPLRDARVMNGPSPFAMVIDHALGRRSELGWLVSNHLIRRAAFECVEQSRLENGDITLLGGEAVSGVRTDADAAQVTLASGAVLKSRLLVAADSRFSTTRRAMGIAADLHDFGRSMLVCCMTHDEPHNHAAWEWFDYGQTLALLPMNDDPATGEHRSSVVLTLPSREIDPLLTLEPSAFNQEMAIRFDRRLGTMTLASTRHVYPLVSVYPRRLVAQRFACVGDAAVGMHPVTAHGFNFGLLSIDNLAATVRAAHATGSDVAAPAGLARYEQTQRRATLPLYLATQLVTQLYTRDTPPARALRTLALHVGERFTPFKRMIAASLTGGA
ncbi:MAG TPA: 5-demethoxyubiquinol-8 5-hydroxylase UbiM [Burkholderiaceae bacterium]|nr:5-demethoxyubiquinol-8 5-hydroxylase UbiM [Burkholderiaceae bacterium]